MTKLLVSNIQYQNIWYLWQVQESVACMDSYKLTTNTCPLWRKNMNSLEILTYTDNPQSYFSQQRRRTLFLLLLLQSAESSYTGSVMSHLHSLDYACRLYQCALHSGRLRYSWGSDEAPADLGNTWKLNSWENGHKQITVKSIIVNSSTQFPYIYYASEYDYQILHLICIL